MNTERLLKLADFLETVPATAFDIDGWQTKKPTKPEGERPGECGFAGCAMGWAAHTKMFPGLSFVQKGWPPYNFWYDLQFKSDDGRITAFSFEASALVMDIEYSDACSLFDPDAYEEVDGPTPQIVAERIRRFVATSSSEPKESGSPRIPDEIEKLAGEW